MLTVALVYALSGALGGADDVAVVHTGEPGAFDAARAIASRLGAPEPSSAPLSNACLHDAACADRPGTRSIVAVSVVSAAGGAADRWNVHLRLVHRDGSTVAARTLPLTLAQWDTLPSLAAAEAELLFARPPPAPVASGPVAPPPPTAPPAPAAPAPAAPAASSIYPAPPAEIESVAEEVGGYVMGTLCLLAGTGALVVFIVDQTGPNPTPTEEYVDGCVDMLLLGVECLRCLAVLGAAPAAAPPTSTGQVVLPSSAPAPGMRF